MNIGDSVLPATGRTSLFAIDLEGDGVDARLRGL
jgi:hypothetical protein